MPFKSKAQMKAAFGGHLGKAMQKKAPEWAEKTKDIKHLPKHVKKEGAVNEASMFASPLEFYVVEKPQSYTERSGEIMFKSSPFGFAKQVMGGLSPEMVHGFYLSEDEASRVAEDLVKKVMEAAQALEEKKADVTGKLDKTIHKLQKEINRHMNEASKDPVAADKHHSMAERKMQMIKALREKHKMVESSKKELPKKDEE